MNKMHAILPGSVSADGAACCHPASAVYEGWGPRRGRRAIRIPENRPQLRPQVRQVGRALLPVLAHFFCQMLGGEL